MILTQILQLIFLQTYRRAELVYDRNRFGIGFRPNFGHFGRISVWPKWKMPFRYRFRYRPKQNSISVAHWNHYICCFWGIFLAETFEVKCKIQYLITCINSIRTWGLLWSKIKLFWLPYDFSNILLMTALWEKNNTAMHDSDTHIQFPFFALLF